MNDHLLPVYNRAAPNFVSGAGSWLTSDDGERWLDCVGGIATNALGHCHPALVAALREQAGTLWHISNMFRIDGQTLLADKLADACFADKVFFTNSGTEAIECALKMARRFHWNRGDLERETVIGFAGSFHGRSYAAINASGNADYLKGFGSVLPGYSQVSLDDRVAAAAAIADPRTAAVIVEPVQGEGGARALSGEELGFLRRACSESGALLIYDEVQSGMGRTGRLFAHQWFEGVEPDIMTIAKALGSGFPVGACLASDRAASGMMPGTHGSTFGGNPLAMAVANAAFDEITRPETLAHAQHISARLRAGLADLAQAFPDIIAELRGKGLLIGVRLIPSNRDFMALARERRLLIAAGGENIVRLLPALTMTEDDAGEALARFGAACAAARARMAEAA